MHQLCQFRQLKIFAFGFLAPRVCLISHGPTHPNLSVVILHLEDTTKSSHHPSTHQSYFFIKKNITIGSTLQVHSTLQSIKLMDPAVDGPIEEFILSGTMFGFGVFNLVFCYFLPKSKEWQVFLVLLLTMIGLCPLLRRTSIQSSLNVLS